MSINVVVREYNKGDYKTILLLFDDYVQHFVEIDTLKRCVHLPGSASFFTNKMLQRVEKNNGKIFVAEDNEKTVGFIAGIVKKQTKEDLYESIPAVPGWVIELYVIKDYRRKKVGSALMSQMEKYFKGKGCDVIFIEVFQPNITAHNFYKQHGYSDRVIDMIKLI